MASYSGKGAIQSRGAGLARSHGPPLPLVACATMILAATAFAAEPLRLVDLRTEFGQALAEFDQAQEIQGKHPDRARQLLLSAAQRFKSLVAAGIINGRLEYNLGNCYLQARDPGRAVLHYRRAYRLIPRDPLLADNLREARSRCLTRVQPTRRSAFLRSVFFWHYQSSITERTKIAAVCYAVFWMLLALRSLRPRRSVSALAFFIGAITLVLAGSVALTHWSERNAPTGVVTAMDVVVYKGPGTGYQRQFEQPLQPGVEFTLQERRGAWWRLELPDGQSGWIDSSDAGLVSGNPQ